MNSCFLDIFSVWTHFVNSGKAILRVLLALLGILQMPSAAATTSERYLLAIGGELGVYAIRDGAMVLERRVLDAQWGDVAAPNVHPTNGTVYFEAKATRRLGSAKIYSLRSLDSSDAPQEVVEGRSPSLSPDGKKIAFYRHPDQLWLMSLIDHSQEKLADDMARYFRQVVWISSSELLFRDTGDRLMLLNTVSMDRKDTGHRGLVPAALSPDRKRVLCGTSVGRRIVLYSIEDGAVKTLVEKVAFSVGPSPVWSLNGDSFLYTRQRLRSYLRLSEGEDLALRSMGGKERFVMSEAALFGGVALPVGLGE